MPKFSILENFLRVKKCQFSNTQTVTKQNGKLCQILHPAKFPKKFTKRIYVKCFNVLAC